MKRALFLVPSLFLVACGQDDVPQEPGQVLPDTDIDELTLQSHFVEELPTYESVPLPEGLEWVTNVNDPVWSSPEATIGGTFNTSVLSFPLTLRTVGPDSNDSFSAYKRYTNLGLVSIHPNTLNFIPQLATHWAFGPDGKTVYYRLDPDARWSDGELVTADDYLFTIDFMRSEHIVAPWYNNHYTNQIVSVVKYDDYTISVEGATAKPREELLYEYGLNPTPRHFHKLDENWVQDYNWRSEPGTGAYRISRVEKGQFVEFGRNEDWWGNDKRYLAKRFNPDTVRVTVIRDMNVAWEYFLRGEIDAFPVLMPRFWHEKAQGEPFDNGYINRIKFYTDTPQPSAGLWLNTDDPVLADRNVRLGLAHAMNIDLLLSTVLRGDYERLKTHHDGYWDYSNPNIQPREFDLQKADEYLDAAGFPNRGPDGIRMRDGQRLSLRVVYSTQEHTPRLVLLREEAKKAGIELNLQLLDSSAAFKQILEKQHQVAWMAWGIGLTPRFWQHYHSENAHKPQTNNITNTDNPEMDALIMEYRAATDKETRVRLAHQFEQMVHESGVFIPTYKVPYTREAYWRWLKATGTLRLTNNGGNLQPDG
ncbi:MAG: ABC transporter substrate-binding protein [Gammaproteobacteria bacterium]|nr:MAG: ABC transporter substrate-binding protein [Gammaproteobacteria bacterium]